MKALLLVLALGLSLNTFASEESKNEKIESLMSLMDMDSLIDNMYTQVEPMMKNMSDQMNIKPSEQPIFDKYYKEMTLILKEEVSWTKMKPHVLAIYDKNFTEQQIDDIVEFYETPTGQAMLNKMPEITQQSVQISQQLLQRALPRIQATSAELAAELKAQRAKEE
tara:strand:- start:400 stop:897 length:498 start_codon:yes stop_codon:yes gene_type:complete